MAAGGEPYDIGEPELGGELPQPPPAWSESAQVIAAVLWPSFLASALATMLFFAFVDPAMVHEATTPPLEVSRMTGYAIGFFFFWFVTALSSAVSVYLLRTRPRGTSN
ncbi:MAG: hypothetical protein L6Q83_04275 [Gammaproteobacteria bacterium]|nr:hypothetical protein [Gammaproteobacteria bacterium]